MERYDVIDLTQSPRSKNDEVEIIKSHPAVSNLIVGRPLPVVQVMEKCDFCPDSSQSESPSNPKTKQEEISISEIQQLKKDKKFYAGIDSGLKKRKMKKQPKPKHKKRKYPCLGKYQRKHRRQQHRKSNNLQHSLQHRKKDLDTFITKNSTKCCKQTAD